MDAQELRNLQEAYMEVVENQQLDEANKAERELNLTSRERIRARNLHQNTDKPIFYAKKNTALKDRSSSTINTAHKKMAAKRRETPTESFDIYDLILSHLLDEGFAETPEAAEAIMVNMSEDWRDDIVEEFLDERNRGERGMSDREVTRRRNLGGNVRSKVSASSLGDHGSQSAIQKFHKTKANQRRAIHKSGRYTRGDTGESGGQGRYQANKDHSDGYPSITKRGQGPG